MTRFFKGLGLGLVATLAMGAVMASAASAEDAPAMFTAEEAPVTIQAGQTTQHVFTASGGTVTCTNASFHGEQGATSAESIDISPSYSSCTAFGFINSTVDVNGCVYVMHADETVDLECPEGKEITITAATCTTHIPSQTGLGTVTYTTGEFGGKHDLTADINIQKIKGNTTSGFFCPATGGAFSDGTLTGTSTVTATNEDENLVGITHHAAKET